MERLPWEELERMVAEAKVHIPPGSRWRHYKGGDYVVVDISIIELTDALAVVYRSMDHPTFTFIRPLVEWQDGKEYNGVKAFRFRRIDGTA